MKGDVRVRVREGDAVGGEGGWGNEEGRETREGEGRRGGVTETCETEKSEPLV